MLVVSLDIDGTIESAGGPISGETIREKLERPDILWGILSSRSVERARQACDELGVKPDFIKVCRVDMRAEELRQLAQEYWSDRYGEGGPRDRYIYVADRDIDRKEAERAGWEFVWADRFREAELAKGG